MGAIATNATTLDKVTSFIFRWLFSTNHKCGALSSSALGTDKSYRYAVTVKPEVAHLKLSKRVMRTFSVVVSLSLGKRTFIMASPFCGARSGISGIIFCIYLNNLFCGVKELRIEYRIWDKSGFSAARTKGLEGTQINCERLKYSYEGGLASLGGRLGRYGKSWSLSDSKRNVVPLSSVKRGISSGVIRHFKSLDKYEGKYVNLIDVVADIDFLQGAYQKIKSNPGVMVKGSSEETLDGLDINWFIKTSERLLNGSFQFKPARRVMIPKPNKPGMRSLTISDSREKIVQQAMKMVLEQIYEPKFLDTSHGFRPSRSPHSALEAIRLNWTSISWFLEFDVEKCYDTIDRNRMVGILKEEINDQRFIDLVFKLFNAGVIGWKGGLGTDPSSGISQGSVVSPILANIYLHKLDAEVARIAKECQKGKIRRKSLEVLNAERRVCRKKDFKPLTSEKRAAIVSKHRVERRKLGVTMTDWNDPNFIRLKYVRFADDVLLGVAGPKELVMKIRDRIQTFVKSDLKLNLTGGEITHIGSGKVKFLGMSIGAVPHSKFPRRFGKMLEKKKRVKNRILLHKKIKEDRLLKIVKQTIKKALRGNAKVRVNSSEVREKVEALKAWVSQDADFSKDWVNTYQEFLRALSGTLIFVPEELRERLKELDLKLTEWQSGLSQISDDPKKKCKELVGRYEALPPRIEAPLKEIREKLRGRGLISKSNKPKAVGRLIHVPDESIVKWYNQVGRGLLNYYSPCVNFYKVKNYVDYMVRWSAIHTLASKHKSSSRSIIAKHTKDLIIKDQEGVVTAEFISTVEIKTMGRQFRTNVSRDAASKALDQIWAKFTRTKFFGVQCAVEGCENPEIEWHHVSKLKRMENAFGNISVVTKKGRRVNGIAAFQVAFNRKQIPLCKMHYTDLHNKRISSSDINWDYVKEVT